MSTIPSVNTDPTNHRATAAKGQRAAPKDNPPNTNEQQPVKPRPADTVQLSEHASSASNKPGRAERLDNLRTEIADRTYPADRYLDTAIERMIDDAARWFTI